METLKRYLVVILTACVVSLGDLVILGHPQFLIGIWLTETVLLLAVLFMFRHAIAEYGAGATWAVMFWPLAAPVVAGVLFVAFCMEAVSKFWGRYE